MDEYGEEEFDEGTLKQKHDLEDENMYDDEIDEDE